MATILLTDADFGDHSIEAEMIAASGHVLRVASSTDPAVLERESKGVDALLVQYCELDSGLLARIPSVRFVSRYGVGVDNIDLSAAAAAGVKVANVPDYGVDEVATHAVALALACVRSIELHTSRVRRGAGDVLAGGIPPDLRTLAVGVVGMGRIGRRFAELITPFVGTVHGFDPFLPAAAWPKGFLRCSSLEELAQASNLLSIHLPFTDATAHLISTHVLEQMLRPSYLINTARAEIVDEAAMLNALTTKELAGAGLDVWSRHVEDQLCQIESVVLTPHSAWLSDGAMRRVRSGAVQNILDWLQQGTSRNVLGG